MGKIINIKKIVQESKYRKEMYRLYESDICQSNNRTVKTAAFIAFIMMSVLTVAAFFVSSVNKVMPLYLTCAVLFLLILIVSMKTGAKNNTVTLVCSYTFLAVAFFFSIALDIIQKNTTATTVCVLLVALPLLIIDKNRREMLFFLIVTILFMLESVFIKQSPKASLDVLNGISFYIIGMFLGMRHNKQMILSFSNKRELEQQRDSDQLTGLYNKGGIENVVSRFMKESDFEASLMVIDMDDFKHVNDTYGHNAGDDLLIEFSRMLKQIYGEDAFISRFGGDEFIVFLPKNNDKMFLSEKAELVIREINKIQLSTDLEYTAGFSMGIAVCPENGDDYFTLFKHADMAMYDAKRSGKNSFCFYNTKTRGNQNGHK